MYTIAQGRLQKSTDAGHTWAVTGSGVLADVRKMVLDQQTPYNVWVGTRDTLFHTEDGGQTRAGAGLPVSGWTSAVLLDPANAQTVYAAVWDQGLFKSVDGGSSWSLIGGGLPAGEGIYTLLVYPTERTKLFAATEYGGLYRSTDGGGNWENITPENFQANRPLVMAPWDQPALYAVVREGLIVSQDDGSS